MATSAQLLSKSARDLTRIARLRANGCRPVVTRKSAQTDDVVAKQTVGSAIRKSNVGEILAAVNDFYSRFKCRKHSSQPWHNSLTVGGSLSVRRTHTMRSTGLQVKLVLKLFEWQAVAEILDRGRILRCDATA